MVEIVFVNHLGPTGAHVMGEIIVVSSRVSNITQRLLVSKLTSKLTAHQSTSAKTVVYLHVVTLLCLAANSQ